MLDMQLLCALPQCTIPNNNDRIDCFPQQNVNERNCLSRGCCWLPALPLNIHHEYIKISVPYCYFPNNFPNYQIKCLRNTDDGIKGKLVKKEKSYLLDEILTLGLEIRYETDSRVRIRITDLKQKRFEIPIKYNSNRSLVNKREYDVVIPRNGPFSIEILRKSDGRSLFKSFGPLLYSDQFLQITTLMSTDQIYGLGEQNRPFLHQLSNSWERIGLWTRDHGIEENNNLYGVHPFYMGMPNDGKAFGVLYLNSNAQEFALQPTPAITYRSTGGILDILIFTGGSPEETVKQYLQFVGKPMLPPYWALGFHLSRFGHKNLTDLSQTIERNINAGIPVDVQHGDIDYMKKRQTFTLDQVNFRNITSFLKSINETHNIRFIPIVDIGIRNKITNLNSAYKTGLAMNIFIKDFQTKLPIVGKSWAGDIVYPDFNHPNSSKYWSQQLKEFYDLLPFDGLWIDLNEPSNFYDGSKMGCPINNKYDNPFFVPNIRDHSLSAKTICPSALHFNNEKHYNLHNLYGYYEAYLTYQALFKIRPKQRQFILSRSTFSGSGKFASHWTGDNHASWDYLKNSIRQVLSFNMFGIPMTGADICGYNGNSNEELCIRWMQLGAFYPFMRNHNAINQRDQDPASWSIEAQKLMKAAISIRYSLLPLFYHLLVKAHLVGATVMRPMSFEFFTDEVTHSLDLQFMIGSSIMVVPTVSQGETAVNAYFPAGVWYDYFSYEAIYLNKKGGWKILQSPLDTINIAIRGGTVVSLFDPQKNIEETRKGPLTLIFALSMDLKAKGDLYWDDGIYVNSVSLRHFKYFKMFASSANILISVLDDGPTDCPIIKKIVILGLRSNEISRVTMKGRNLNYLFNSTTKVLQLNDLYASMESTILIQWEEQTNKNK